MRKDIFLDISHSSRDGDLGWKVWDVKDKAIVKKNTIFVISVKKSAKLID